MKLLKRFRSKTTTTGPKASLHRSGPVLSLLLLPTGGKVRWVLPSLVTLSLLLLVVDLISPFLVSRVLLQVLNHDLPRSPIGALAIPMLLVLALGRAIVAYIRARWISRFRSCATRSLRLDLGSALLSHRPPESRDGAAAWAAGVNSDLMSVETFVSVVVWDTLGQASLFVGGAWIIWALDRSLALWCLAPLPIAVALNMYVTPRMRSAMDIHYGRVRELNLHFQEFLEGWPVISTYQAQESLLGRFGRAVDQTRESAESMDRWSAMHGPLYEWMGATAVALLLLGGRSLLSAGRLDSAALLSFFVFLGYFYRPVFSSSRLLEGWQRARSAKSRLDSLLFADGKREGQRSFDRSTPSRIKFAAAPEILVRDVRFSYGRDADVLDSLSLRIPAGKITAIVGNNGAGKSTLLKIVAGLLSPSDGQILYDGRSDVPRHEIVYLPQEPFLFSAGGLENLKLCCPDAEEEEIASWGARLGIPRRLLSSDQGGVGQRLSVRGTSISGGQRQRLSILRFILRAKSKSICLLDEPSNCIDAQSEEQIVTSLLDACRGKTTLIVTHRQSTLAMCHSTLSLDRSVDELLARRTSPAAVVASGGAYPVGTNVL